MSETVRSQQIIRGARVLDVPGRSASFADIFIDGDTIVVLEGKEQHKIRLHGIDCPERKQPFGTKSKQFTSDMCFGK